MAIIKRTDTETQPASTPANGPIAVHKAPAPPAPEPPPAPPAPPGEGTVRSMTETLPNALEPELRRIIDTAVARVAAIELDAIREARELTQRSEQEAREALKFALDRAFNLINTLELLATTVSGMAEALKIELDDAMDALRKVPEPESALAREMAESAPAQEAPTPEPVPTPEPPPTPEPVPVAEPPPAAAQPPPPAVAEPALAEAEEPVAEQPSPEEPAVEEPPREVVPAAGAGTSWYPPAERQAKSLAAAPKSEPETKPEPEAERERTVVRARASQDGGMVPGRRRGLIRRLFAK